MQLSFRQRLTIARAVRPQKFFVEVLSLLGLAWLLVEPIGLFSPASISALNLGLWGYSVLVGIAVLVAVAGNLSRFSQTLNLSSPDASIELKFGNILSEQCHVVVGTNDVFDTMLGSAIKPTSVQGQFTQQVYSGNASTLDLDIQTQLNQRAITGVKDSSKTLGKNVRYKLGTVLSLGSPQKRYFLVAYATMDNNFNTSATINDIWSALDALWDEFRRIGQGDELAIPVIGSDLARTNLSRNYLAKMIILSFIAASRRRIVAKKLTIVLYPGDADKVDWYDLVNFLDNAAK